MSASSTRQRSAGGSGSGLGGPGGLWEHVSFRERDGAVPPVIPSGNDSRFGQCRPGLPPPASAVAGLPGHDGSEQEFQRSIERSILAGRHFALLYLDLDRRERIRQDLGPAGAEQVLVRVARRLTGQLRGIDSVARLQGDVFAVLLVDTSTPDEAVHRARKIVAAIGRPIEVEDNYLMPTTSVGVALFGADGCTVEELERAAAVALARARRLGGAQVVATACGRSVAGQSAGRTNLGGPPPG